MCCSTTTSCGLKWTLLQKAKTDPCPKKEMMATCGKFAEGDSVPNGATHIWTLHHSNTPPPLLQHPLRSHLHAATTNHAIDANPFCGFIEWLCAPNDPDTYSSPPIVQHIPMHTFCLLLSQTNTTNLHNSLHISNLSCPLLHHHHYQRLHTSVHVRPLSPPTLPITHLTHSCPTLGTDCWCFNHAAQNITTAC